MLIQSKFLLASASQWSKEDHEKRIVKGKKGRFLIVRKKERMPGGIMGKSFILFDDDL